jgi:hypothetical protein
VELLMEEHTAQWRALKFGRIVRRKVESFFGDAIIKRRFMRRLLVWNSLFVFFMFEFASSTNCENVEKRDIFNMW